MRYLNDPHVTPYMGYQGNIGSNMLGIKDDGRRLISPSLLFWRRLETLNEYLGALKRKDLESATKAWKKVMSDWWEANIYTCFGVARHPDKGAILIPDMQQYLDLILSYNAHDNKLDFRTGILPDGMYEKLDGFVYSKREVEKYGGTPLTQEQTLESPLWKDFIPDEILRVASIINFFEQYSKQHAGGNGLMGVEFPKVEKKPLICLFQFKGIDWGFTADGNYIYDDNAYMVGALPSIAVGDVGKLEHIVQTRLPPELYFLAQPQSPVQSQR